MVRARVQEYALAISGCSHLVVRGLRFFATTLYAAGEQNDVRYADAAPRQRAHTRSHQLAACGCETPPTLRYMRWLCFERSSDVHNVRFDSLSLIHPSATKRLLGECRFSHPTTLARKRNAEGSNNTVFNVTMVGSEGHPLINTAGAGMTFENNLVGMPTLPVCSPSCCAYEGPV